MISMVQRWNPSQLVCAVTLLIGAVTLGWSLSIKPGNQLFYAATAILALVWMVGALVSHLLLRREHAHVRTFGHGAHEVVQPWSSGRASLAGVLSGFALLGMFLVGAVVLARIPVLREPVLRLLDHAQQGDFTLVFALTLINGAAEEMFFRGALYNAVHRHRPIVLTTLIYTVVTAASGIWMLALAGIVLGFAAAVARRLTGTVLAPMLMHLTWSVGMILLLPRVLTMGS